MRKLIIRGKNEDFWTKPKLDQNIYFCVLQKQK